MAHTASHLVEMTDSRGVDNTRVIPPHLENAKWAPYVADMSLHTTKLQKIPGTLVHMERMLNPNPTTATVLYFRHLVALWTKIFEQAWERSQGVGKVRTKHVVVLFHEFFPEKACKDLTPETHTSYGDTPDDFLRFVKSAKPKHVTTKALEHGAAKYLHTMFRFFIENTIYMIMQIGIEEIVKMHKNKERKRLKQGYVATCDDVYKTFLIHVLEDQHSVFY